MKIAREPETRAEIAYELALEDVKLAEVRTLLASIEERRATLMRALRRLANDRNS